MVTPHIGVLREKPLHASLKAWYARPGDAIEVPVDGYVIDLVRGERLIEIQTRGFSSMKAKLARLLGLGHVVRVVHPIAVDRWIVKIGDDGAVTSRRRSPRHGTPADVFTELVNIADLLTSPNLEIEVVLTIEEELRRHRPDGPWRRSGWAVEERRLVEVVGTLRICDNDDLAGLLPKSLSDAWTTADLAAELGAAIRTARQMAYCLRTAGVITPVGKRGRSVLYESA